MWAYNYPHNVNEAGVILFPAVLDKYCNELPMPVYPTPFYEISDLSYFICCSLVITEKDSKYPAHYLRFILMLNGLERFFIEKIRVNTRLNIFGFHPPS